MTPLPPALPLSRHNMKSTSRIHAHTHTLQPGNSPRTSSPGAHNSALDGKLIQIDGDPYKLLHVDDPDRYSTPKRDAMHLDEARDLEIIKENSEDGKNHEIEIEDGAGGRKDGKINGQGHHCAFAFVLFSLSSFLTTAHWCLL